jgi:hypothetical protein
MDETETKLVLTLQILFLDLSEMGRMEKQFLMHLEKIEDEKQVRILIWRTTLINTIQESNYWKKS